MYAELCETVTRSDFNELKEVVSELAQAQKRTEQRVEELAEAQKRTEARLDSLIVRVDQLAEAQKRTEQRVEELAEAQKRTEARLDSLVARVEELAEAQKRTEARLDSLIVRMDQLAEAQINTEKALQALAIRLDDTNKQLGGLSATVGYTLENEAYKHLPALLGRDFGIVLEDRLKRGFLTDLKHADRHIEVNILGKATRDGKPILVVGESKVQISRSKLLHYIEIKLPLLDTGGVEPFVVIVAHMETEPGLAELARSRGAALYFSYEF
jgi:uncharacterized phage infection (PIP) family protein YhgE